MLVPQDDLIGHQQPTSFAHTATSDPAWMERLWYTCHPVPRGDVMLMVGLGYYPNRNTMDGFVSLFVEGRQYNFQASRRLGRNPLEIRIGPLRIDVLEGMRKHRLRLDQNESGLMLDITFEASFDPHEEEHRQVRRNNRLGEDLTRYQQAGRYSGWIEGAGKRFMLDKELWWGQRDHSWGVRSPLHTDESNPPVRPFPPMLFLWCVAQFPSRAIHIFMMDKGPGNFIYLTAQEISTSGGEPDPGRRILTVQHEFRFQDDKLPGQTVRSFRLILTFQDGSRETLEATATGARIFLKGGLYGGLDGWSQGDDKGKLFSQHSVWDLADTEIRRKLRTLSDNVMVFRLGDETGYGIAEPWVTDGYPIYKEAQGRLSP